jgi:CO/xanthine dehydrogenase FAD-binding subunit
MWDTYLQPTSVAETLGLLQRCAGQAQIVAGGTDVLVELSRGAAELRPLRARGARVACGPGAGSRSRRAHGGIAARR